MDHENHIIDSGGITAMISANGAELRSLRNAQGIELLWQVGPSWPRHAPGEQRTKKYCIDIG